MLHTPFQNKYRKKERSKFSFIQSQFCQQHFVAIQFTIISSYILILVLDKINQPDNIIVTINTSFG